MILEHPGYVEILNGNHVKPLNEHSGQLVQGIGGRDVQLWPPASLPGRMAERHSGG